MRGRFEPLVPCAGVDGHGCRCEPPPLVESGKVCSNCRKGGPVVPLAELEEPERAPISHGRGKR